MNFASAKPDVARGLCLQLDQSRSPLVVICAMGNPLEISELRLLICRELYTTDLGALRLTCKRWSPEAEQEMWSHVFRLLPLLRLIPEDAWLEGETVSIKMIRAIL